MARLGEREGSFSTSFVCGNVSTEHRHFMVYIKVTLDEDVKVYIFVMWPILFTAVTQQRVNPRRKGAGEACRGPYVE